MNKKRNQKSKNRGIKGKKNRSIKGKKRVKKIKAKKTLKRKAKKRMMGGMNLDEMHFQFMEAVKTGDYIIVEATLDGFNGYNLDAFNGYNPDAFINRMVEGDTALFYACDLGYDKVVSLLLTRFPRTIDVNKATEDDGSTPLFVACWQGYDKVVDILLEHYATNVNKATTDNGETPLFAACLKGHDKVVRRLLDHTATDVNQRTNDGRTPLYAVCNVKNKELARILLEHDRVARSIDRIIEIPNHHDALVTYVNALHDVKRRRRARFRGLVRLIIVFRHMRLRAAKKVYAPPRPPRPPGDEGDDEGAPGGTGFEAAQANFNMRAKLL